DHLAAASASRHRMAVGDVPIRQRPPEPPGDPRDDYVHEECLPRLNMDIVQSGPSAGIPNVRELFELRTLIRLDQDRNVLARALHLIELTDQSFIRHRPPV